jgi:5-methylcytosine-specific restriction protein A
VAELLACNRLTATRLARLASQMFPTTLAGQPVDPVLPATAAALAAWSIHPDHAEVISRVMSGRAARRLSPQQWAGAERQCAEWAAVYNPHTLRTLAEALIEQLDQDGDEPDVDADDQVNELHQASARNGRTPRRERVADRLWLVMRGRCPSSEEL